MALAGKYDMTCEAGATFERVITVTNADDTTPNYATSTGKMQVRAAYGSANPVVLELSTTNTRISMAANVITLLVAASDTNTLAVGNYIYDLEITTGTRIDRLLQGKFTITDQVTLD